MEVFPDMAKTSRYSYSRPLYDRRIGFSGNYYDAYGRISFAFKVVVMVGRTFVFSYRSLLVAFLFSGKEVFI